MAVEIEGLKPLLKKLDTLPAKVAKDHLRKALRAGGNVILKATRSAAPEGSTRRLKKALKLKSLRSRKKDRLSFAIQTKEGDYKGATFYAAFVHFGHKIGHRRLGDSRASTRPNTFMRDAANAHKSGATEAIADTLRARLEAERA